MSRKTKQKLAILRVLRASQHHPTASWIYERVRREMPAISLGTVYRDLRALTEEGEISEVVPKGSLSRFDGNPKNHYHFRCQRCGSILDIAGPVDTGLDRRLAKNSGLEVWHHRLEFYGLCQICQT